MYRKVYTPQLKGLPNNYSGWAASEEASVPPEKTQTDAGCCDTAALPSHAPAKREECHSAEKPLPVLSKGKENAKDLNDLLLIGAILLLLLTQKKDPQNNCSSPR